MKKLFTLTAIFINCIFAFGQSVVINNNQTEILQIPLKKVVKYFKNYDNRYVDYKLNETKIDSINQKDSIITVYLTENKAYNSAEIITNLNGYQKIIKDKSFEGNLIMLFKGEFNEKTLKSPIKPIIRESFTKNGILKWKIIIEPTNSDSTKLTFIFDSFNKKHKQNFITKFSKGIDGNFNYTIQKIYITENFKSDIIKYIQDELKSDATDVPPMKGNI